MTKNEVFFQLRTAARALMAILVAEAESGDLLSEDEVEELRDAMMCIEGVQALMWPAEEVSHHD